MESCSHSVSRSLHSSFLNTSPHHSYHLCLRAKLCCEHLWISGCEDGLIRAVDLIQQEAASMGIQLGHYFIQQQDRPVVDLRAHPMDFGQLKRQHRRALLAPRSVDTQIDLVGDEAQFVAMRTD